MEKGEQLTFIKLFKKYGCEIEIPIIQRDYAQGRDSTKEVRTRFLDSIKTKLEQDINIHLDFIYGYMNSENKFIPLDGQQRLTTLFLLYWYMAHISKKIEDFKSVMQDGAKSKFTYETRVSSREFCNALLKNNFDVSNWEQLNISDIIKDSSWFYYSWELDPTIKGMLVMLDAIQEKFGATCYYHALTRNEDPIITFNFLNLEEYKLNGDLYIKMNARGKQLTDFEIFKAKFQNFIEEHHSKEVSDYFKTNIDGVWCDLFWDFRTEKNEVDELLHNFIKYIAEMLYYQNEVHKFETTDIDVIQIFKSEENLNFLFKAFGLFVNNNNFNFKEQLNNFFLELFSCRYESQKIALFDDEINLFSNCINGLNFDHKHKLLLYAILYYQGMTNLKLDITDNLKDYLRVIRNFILRINLANKDVLVSDLRVSEYVNIIKTIHLIYDSDNVYLKLTDEKKFGFREDNIGHEIHKAKYIHNNDVIKKHIHKLEDHHYFKGSLHNFDFIYSEDINTEKIVNLIYDVWGIHDDSLITRSLLSIGDYSISIGWSSSFGDLRFFGKSDKWHTIFSSYEYNENKKNLKKILKEYITALALLEDSISILVKLDKLIDSGLKKENSKSWIYYFLKYPQITTNKNKWAVYAFTVHDVAGFRVEYINGTSLSSYHTDILNKAVIQSESVDSKQINGDSWVYNSNHTPLFCKNGVKLYPKNNYWEVEIPNELVVSDTHTKFKLIKVQDKKRDDSIKFYKLNITDEFDLVQIAICFINNFHIIGE